MYNPEISYRSAPSKNITEPNKTLGRIDGNIAFQELLTAIKIGYLGSNEFQSTIQSIRTATDEETAKKLKYFLPSVTVSCTCGRSARDITAHSGLLQIDFDELPAGSENFSSIRQLLIKDKFTYACCYSPRNKVKVIVRIPADQEKHHEIFLSIEQYYLQRYKLKIDQACKNINRLMFLTYDPEIFINEAAVVYMPAAMPLTEKQRQKPVIIPRSDTATDVESCLDQIETSRIDITGSYDEWLKIGFALADEFGESGRHYFHRVSVFNSTYDVSEADKQFSNCLRGTGKGRIKIATFFGACKDHGIKPERTKKEGPKSKHKPTEVIKKAVPTASDSESGKVERPQSKFDQVEEYLNRLYDFRYNEVLNDVEYKLKDSIAWESCNDANIYRRLKKDGIAFSQNDLKSLLRSDFISKYNPFNRYFEHLQPFNPSSEADHITKLCTYVSAKNQERFNRQFKKMIVRSVACALGRKFNKQAFILVHAKQNSGKSTFCRWLCPDELGQYFCENISPDSKDSLIALTDKFIINLDELASLSKYDINQLKSFLSKDSVSVRRPYDTRSTVAQRRANFVGSTNNFDFLSDSSGSVRWLCFEIDKINWNYKTDVDINRVWAQAYYLFNDGFKFELTEIEVAENETANDEFTQVTPEYELVQKYFEPSDQQFGTFLTTTEIGQELGLKCSYKLSLKAIGQALRKAGFERCSNRNNSVISVYGYHVKRLL
jgi:hypothetical protein